MQQDQKNLDNPAGPVALPYFSAGSARFLRRRLTLHGAAFVACRVVALWLVAQVLQSVGLVLAYLIAWGFSSGGSSRYSSPELMGLMAVVPPVVVPLAVAGVLWWKADWLAERIVRDPVGFSGEGTREEAHPAQSAAGLAGAAAGGGPTDEGQAMEYAPDAAEESRPLLAVALMAVGALVLAGAMPELARLIADLLASNRPDVTGVGFQVSLWSPLIKCAIGLWLLLGAGGTARLIFRLRRRDAGAAASDRPRAADGPL